MIDSFIQGPNNELQLTLIDDETMTYQPQLRQQSASSTAATDYQNVRVLLLSWEDGQGIDKIEKDLHELEEVFNSFYKFTVDHWKIPLEGSTAKLNRCLLNFAEDAREGDLLIVYYAGHGKMSIYGRHLLWKCYDDFDPPLINWSFLALVFTEIPADVLMILDCCHAGSCLNEDRHLYRSSSIYKVWAACGFDSRTPLAGEYSFTSNLTKVLRRSYGAPSRLEDIHNQLCNRLRRTILPDSEEVCTNPILEDFTSPDAFRSIVLKQLVRQPENLLSYDASQQPPSMVSGARRVGMRVPRPGAVAGRMPAGHFRRSSGATTAVLKASHGDLLLPSNSPIYVPGLSSESVMPVDEPSLLRNLMFESMFSRIHSVSSLRHSSLPWALEDDHPSGLAHWLQYGNGFFWVAGEPGSGKSTLMKMIIQFDKTQRLLHKWADQQLQTASYFFCCSGTELEHSFEGFSRSVLFQILNDQPSLIRYLPQALRSSQAGLPHSNALVTQLHYFLTGPAFDSFRLCLIIDALDECEEASIFILLRLLRDIVSSGPRVKICVSSRPSPIFVSEFKPYPTLWLRDVTYPDILKFAHKMLESSHEWSSLAHEDPLSASVIISKLVERSSGAFLWISLVVHSIIRELRVHDSLQTLKLQLEDIPTGITPLYRNLLSKVDMADRQEISNIFQLVKAAHTVVLGPGSQRVMEPNLTTVGLSLALSLQCCSQVLRESVEPFSDQKISQLDQRMADKLDVATAGLLTVDLGGQIIAKSAAGHLIKYSHESSRQFLDFPDIWSLLTEITLSHDFIPSLRLLRSTVCQLKKIDIGLMAGKASALINEVYEVPCWALLEQAIGYAYDVSQPSFERQWPELVMLLDELDRTMTLQLQRWSRNTTGVHWSCFIPPAVSRQHEWEDNFLSLMVARQILPYVREKIPVLSIAKRGQPLLAYACLPRLGAIVANPEMIRLLLQYGADSDEEFQGKSVWRQFVDAYSERGASSAATPLDQDKNLREVFSLLVRYRPCAPTPHDTTTRLTLDQVE